MKAVIVALCLIGLASSARIVQKTDINVDQILDREICYTHYGCFSTNHPWTSLLRPLAALPKAPWEVGTRFVLFTRGDHETEQIGYELMPDKDAIQNRSDFNPERKTFILIHGFTDTYKTDWVWNTKDLLLQNENVNVISVDWSSGAKGRYLQTTANARLVGAMVARMITYLEQKANLNIDDVHVISHSLGGHVAGYAGDRLMGRIPRITAIDPMDQYFSGTDPIVRLDTSDAKFVEVIHSNAQRLLTNIFGLGIDEAIGHVDLYPNGGAVQPGCKDTLGNIIGSIIDLITLDFEGAISQWACSHARAAHFYAESISNAHTCPFVSFECRSYSEFEKGNCYHGARSSLGYNARNQANANGVFYLHTTDGAQDSAYCNQVAQIQAIVGLDQSQTSGSLSVTFQSEEGSKSGKIQVIDGKMTKGQILSTWADVPSSVLRSSDDRPTLILRYSRGLLQPRTLSIDSLNLVVIKSDLSIVTIPYNGVVLEAGKDTPVSAL